MSQQNPKYGKWVGNRLIVTEEEMKYLVGDKEIIDRIILVLGINARGQIQLLPTFIFWFYVGQEEAKRRLQNPK